jgi:hypothetical protein
VAEPVTVLTDYVLAAVALVLAWRLRGESVPARRLWAAALLATALAALAGGTEHGLRPRLASGQRFGLLASTYLSVGAANALLLVGAARVAFRRPARTVASVLVAARFALFAVVVLREPVFRPVLLDFAVTLVLLAALGAWGLWRGHASAPFVLGAVAVSLVAALVQLRGLGLHEHFNHNDVFHVVQTLGVVLFHGAAARLVEKDAQPAGTIR